MNQSALSNQRVFIVGEDLLFEEGIAHLLTTRANMQVTRERFIDDLWLADIISQNQADVILLVESEFLNSNHLLDLLFSIRSLECSWIVIVRLDNNMVDVYEPPNEMNGQMICRQQRFNITDRDELVAIVQGNFEHIPNNVFSLLPCGSGLNNVNNG